VLSLKKKSYQIFAPPVEDFFSKPEENRRVRATFHCYKKKLVGTSWLVLNYHLVMRDTNKIHKMPIICTLFISLKKDQNSEQLGKDQNSEQIFFLFAGKPDIRSQKPPVKNRSNSNHGDIKRKCVIDSESGRKASLLKDRRFFGLFNVRDIYLYRLTYDNLSWPDDKHIMQEVRKDVPISIRKPVRSRQDISCKTMILLI